MSLLLGQKFGLTWYRLRLLGFLACDEPKISGNFGFKDHDGIGIQSETISLLSEVRRIHYSSITDLTSGRRKPRRYPSDWSSAGWTANLNWKFKLTISSRCTFVHQLLHFASRLPSGTKAPFRSGQFCNPMPWRKHSQSYH